MKTHNHAVFMKGKQIMFPHNLSGRPMNVLSKHRVLPLPIIKVKKTIIDKFIIPIYSNDWQSIKENFFLLDRIQDRMNKYKKSYNESDLDVYDYLIKFIKNHFDQHSELEEMETKFYGKNGYSSNFATLLFKTPPIHLKAEYEIYNLLYGKPNKQQNETYNILYLNKIIDLLKIEDITFEEIKKEMIVS